MMLVLAVALVAAILVAQYVYDARPPAPTETGEDLLDAVFDRTGVTQWAELVQWYTLLEEEGEMPVWIARNGRTHFHSVPVCGGMKNPVEYALTDAAEAGFQPCEVCWDVGTQATQ